MRHRTMTVVRLASHYGTTILMLIWPASKAKHRFPMPSIGGHKKAVKKLLDDTRLDPNLTSDHLSPVAIAAGSGSMELLEMLLSDQRVTVNSQDQGYIDLVAWALFRE